MNSKGHALSRDELIRVLTAYSGVTTDNGTPGGTTLIDINLKDNPSISEHAIPQKTILIMSGDAVMEDKGAASFVNATGTITLQGTGFSAQIKKGTTFRILNISSVETSMGGTLFSMDFWSDPQEEVSIPAVAGTLSLPDVTIADLPTGATIVRAIAMIKFRMVENTNVAANKLNGATVATTSQVIQVRDDTPGTWYDAINFVDDQFGIAASTREGGDVCIGSIDIAGSGKVDANDVYNFRYLLAKADVASLNFNDVQCGLRLWYSV